MAYTPIGWTESTPVNATNLDKMDGQIDANDNRITNLEDYTVGNTTIFQSLSQFATTSVNYVTAKEILVGKSGSARLTFEMKGDAGVGFDYRILVDGLEVANGSNSGTTNWIGYTEDISFQAGSNIKVQVAVVSVYQGIDIYLQNFRFKIGNQSDMILEL